MGVISPGFSCGCRKDLRECSHSCSIINMVTMSPRGSAFGLPPIMGKEISQLLRSQGYKLPKATST
jgi:hypothetical protein